MLYRASPAFRFLGSSFLPYPAAYGLTKAAPRCLSRGCSSPFCAIGSETIARMMRWLITPKLNACKSLTILVVVWASLANSAVLAQTDKSLDMSYVAQKDLSGGRGPEFDVVSIRPSKSGEIWGIHISSDGYQAFNLPLWKTIVRAYFPPPFQSRDSLLGAPDWVWVDKFDIVAKISANDAAEWDKQRLQQSSLASGTMLQLMLQAALKDRCKFVVHTVPTKTSGLALVLGKHGPNTRNLKEAQPDKTIPSGALSILDGGKMIPLMPNKKRELTFFQTSMISLAAELTALSSVPVENRTGLTGKYDFVVPKREDLPSQMGQTDGSTNDQSPWEVGELGLELKRVKLQTLGLVIDHVDRPSPN
jgi:uncharacterized protein (TIGR03435 family)